MSDQSRACKVCLVSNSIKLILIATLCLASAVIRGQIVSEWEQTDFSENNPVYFIKEINDTLFAGSQKGLFCSIDKGDTWSILSDLTYISSIVYHKDKFYVGSRKWGIHTTHDFKKWSNITQDAPNIVTDLLSTSGGLYMATYKGVYKWLEPENKWLKEPLVNASPHNEYIWQIIEVNKSYYAVGSNFVYKFMFELNQWNKIIGDYGFEALQTRNINDSLVISSSGDGLLLVSAGLDSLMEYTSRELITEAKYILDFNKLGTDLIFISQNNLIYGDSINDNVCNSLLTSLFAQNDLILVGTDKLGIWKRSPLGGCISLFRTQVLNLQYLPNLT